MQRNYKLTGWLQGAILLSLTVLVVSHFSLSAQQRTRLIGEQSPLHWAPDGEEDPAEYAAGSTSQQQGEDTLVSNSSDMKTSLKAHKDVAYPVDPFDPTTWERNNQPAEVYDGMPVDPFDPSTWKKNNNPPESYTGAPPHPFQPETWKRAPPRTVHDEPSEPVDPFDEATWQRSEFSEPEVYTGELWEPFNAP